MSTTSCRSTFFRTENKSIYGQTPTWLSRLTRVAKKEIINGKSSEQIENAVSKAAETLTIMAGFIVFGVLPAFL